MTRAKVEPLASAHVPLHFGGKHLFSLYVPRRLVPCRFPVSSETEKWLEH